MATKLWLPTIPASESPDIKSWLDLTTGRHTKKLFELKCHSKFGLPLPNLFVPYILPNRIRISEKTRANSITGRRKSKNNFEFSRARSNRAVSPRNIAQRPDQDQSNRRRRFHKIGSDSRRISRIFDIKTCRIYQHAYSRASKPPPIHNAAMPLGRDVRRRTIHRSKAYII